MYQVLTVCGLWSRYSESDHEQYSKGSKWSPTRELTLFSGRGGEGRTKNMSVSKHAVCQAMIRAKGQAVNRARNGW